MEDVIRMPKLEQSGYPRFNQHLLKQAEREIAFRSALFELEEHVEKLVAGRHDYPVWPDRDNLEDYPMDAFEHSIHDPVRHIYYRETLFLLYMMRLMRHFLAR